VWQTDRITTPKTALAYARMVKTEFSRTFKELWEPCVQLLHYVSRHYSIHTACKAAGETRHWTATTQQRTALYSFAADVSNRESNCASASPSVKQNDSGSWCYLIQVTWQHDAVILNWLMCHSAGTSSQLGNIYLCCTRKCTDSWD